MSCVPSKGNIIESIDPTRDTYNTNIYANMPQSISTLWFTCSALIILNYKGEEILDKVMKC